MVTIFNEHALDVVVMIADYDLAVWLRLEIAWPQFARYCRKNKLSYYNSRSQLVKYHDRVEWQVSLMRMRPSQCNSRIGELTRVTVLHRDHEPAVMYLNRNHEYYRLDRLHRRFGPAKVIGATSTYYHNGREVGCSHGLKQQLLMAGSTGGGNSSRYGLLERRVPSVQRVMRHVDESWFGESESRAFEDRFIESLGGEFDTSEGVSELLEQHHNDCVAEFTIPSSPAPRMLEFHTRARRELTIASEEAYYNDNFRPLGQYHNKYK